MEIATKTAWFLLALVHISPAAMLFRPGLVQRLAPLVLVIWSAWRSVS